VERNVLFLIIAYMRDYKYVDKTKIPIVENILNVKIGINMVLVKPLVDNSVLDNGLYMDTSFREIDCANRIVEVIKTPLILAIKGLDGYDERNYRALDWGTVMELKVGDKAWVDPLYMVLNNHTNGTSVYQCDDEFYYVVPYDKFIVAKRECNINFSETTEKSYDGEKSKMYLADEAGMTITPKPIFINEGSTNFQVICLNGYILIEEIKKVHKIGAFKKTILDQEGVVAYSGRGNDYYYDRPYSDDIQTDKGDRVFCPKHRIYLEDEMYASFEGKKQFIITQRRQIFYSYKSDTMALKDKKILPGKLWIKRDETVTKSLGGLLVPEEAQKQKNTGEVVKMGPFRKGEEVTGLKEGSKICFLRTSRNIEFEKVIYAVIDMLDIEYYE
jgi:co-chaperonin GroES (HSP10)